jgi:hypothetical protein
LVGACAENYHPQRAPLTITNDVLTHCNRIIVVVSMKVWVDHMAKSSALMSYNVFTFPNEAQMQLHIKIWEEHSPLMFEQLKAKGCLAYSYNQIWNSPGTFKTSAIFEYESPEAFKACQQVMKDYGQSIESETRGLDVVIEASRNIIRHHSRVRQLDLLKTIDHRPQIKPLSIAFTDLSRRPSTYLVNHL